MVSDLTAFDRSLHCRQRRMGLPSGSAEIDPWLIGRLSTGWARLWIPWRPDFERYWLPLSSSATLLISVWRWNWSQNLSLFPYPHIMILQTPYRQRWDDCSLTDWVLYLSQWLRDDIEAHCSQILLLFDSMEQPYYCIDTGIPVPTLHWFLSGLVYRTFLLTCGC